MDHEDESLGHNREAVGIVITDVRAQSDSAKLNVFIISPYPSIIVFL